MMAMGRDAWIVAFVLLCSCLGSYSLTLQVEPKTTECFYEYFEAGQNVSLNYGVTRGGLLDILVQVRYEGPRKMDKLVSEVLLEKMHFENQEEGLFEFAAAREGTYAVCFNNEFAKFTAKVVYFKFLNLRDKYKEGDKLDPLEDAAVAIAQELELLEMHQHYMRGRELRHSITQSSTSSRILLFSFAEFFVLATIAFIQVYYLKRCFEVKKSAI